jgi:hypothetical protein
MGRYGTRIRNRQTGSIQIDDLYANMALRSKTTLTVSAGLVGDNLRSAAFTFVASELPVVAFQCSAPTFLAWVTRDNGSNSWTFTFWSYTASASTTVACYEFGEPPVLGPGWGMRIMRAGQVKYDSRHRYARIASTLRGEFDTASDPGSSGPAANLPAGATYAIVMGSRTGRSNRLITPVAGAQNGYNDNMSAAALGVAVNGASVSSQYLLTQFSTTFFPVPPSPPPPPGYNYRQPQYSWAVLDVTGF